MAWCGMALCGVVWCGMLWHGMAWYGMEWCGIAWCGCGVAWDIVQWHMTSRWVCLCEALHCTALRSACWLHLLLELSNMHSACYKWWLIERKGQRDSFSYSPLLAVSRLTRLPLLSVSPWNFSSRLDALYVVTWCMSNFIINRISMKSYRHSSCHN